MTESLSAHAVQVDLPAGVILTLPDAAGLGVECRSGSVWLTLDDDPRDIVLSPGERFEADVHRRALVSALSPSSITVSQAHVTPWLRRANARVCLDVSGPHLPHALAPA
ncbi:MAG: DUF2917 domain-containing protein [Comamonadaceae bacterium]|nr:MAG: DUF2917 domain-containing protein [Comamonadaceae bacterium]